MPIVDVNGKQISYWLGRGGLGKEKEVVLFIHGAGGGQFTWSYQKGFFEKQFSPIVLELPGHGDSGGEGEDEIGKYAEHIHSLLNELGLQKVFLVGHSMGGAITQTIALTHPEMVKGIVLVGTGAKLKVFPMILNGIKANFKETIPQIIRFAYSRKTPLELIERGVNDMLRCRPEVLYGDFLACDRFNFIDQIEKIDLPTLILCGDEDQLTPVKYSQFLHQTIKGSKLEILPDAGHMVMMESPGAFNQKVGEFTLTLH
jgi:pimeloyl-ACP methyl ester carboxylesterase